MGVLGKLHRRLVPPVGLDGQGTEDMVSEREALGILRRVALALVRGALLRLRARHGRGAVLVGPRVRVTDAHRLTLGRHVKIEEGAEIQCRSVRGVVLGDGVTVGRGASIRPSSYYGHAPGEGLVVGSGSAIGPLCWIGASGQVVIGADVLLGPRVTILPENHVFDDTGRAIKAQGVRRERVVIGDDCWIGAGAIILAGVRIGRGSVVAAGAVVSRDVPALSVVGGVPARVLRSRAGSAAPLRRAAA